MLNLDPQIIDQDKVRLRRRKKLLKSCRGAGTGLPEGYEVDVDRMAKCAVNLLSKKILVFNFLNAALR